ncbi:hypothetical protein J7L05_09340 [bacterium]|nr:hypothetical protein [bacterium]
MQSKDKNNELTIKFEGHDLLPEVFIDGVNEFFKIIKAVTEEICEDESLIKWIIQVREGSTEVVFKQHQDCKARKVELVKDSVQQGLRILEEKIEEPRYFSDKAIRHAQQLAGILGKSKGTDLSISILGRSKPVNITNNIIEHTKEILRAGQAYGSVEGWLHTISMREKPHFVLYEPVWDKAIRCWIDENKLSSMFKLFGKRIEVFGDIRYKKDGTPVSITVDNVIPFPEADDIPDFHSVIGILENY